jgi:hypothetical protein
MGLGPLWLVEQEKARELAREARQQLRQGIDPLTARRAEKAAQKASEARALTFREASEAFYDQHKAKWSNRKHAAQFLSSLAQQKSTGRGGGEGAVAKTQATQTSRGRSGRPDAFRRLAKALAPSGHLAPHLRRHAVLPRRGRTVETAQPVSDEAAKLGMTKPR